MPWWALSQDDLDNVSIIANQLGWQKLFLEQKKPKPQEKVNGMELDLSKVPDYSACRSILDSSWLKINSINMNVSCTLNPCMAGWANDGQSLLCSEVRWMADHQEQDGH